MKRWLVALLVLLAVTVLVSPGIIGRLAEDNLERALPGGSAYGEGDYIVTREHFERGWFTTEGRHRIEIRHGRVHDLILELAELEPDAVPVLIVDTHVDHGLVPVTSMARESGSLRPGLASTVSTMALDPGTGEPLAIPGKLYSNIGLTGDTTTRYLLDSGSFASDGFAASWEGADLSFTIGPTGRSADFAWTGSSWSFRRESSPPRSVSTCPKPMAPRRTGGPPSCWRSRRRRRSSCRRRSSTASLSLVPTCRACSPREYWSGKTTSTSWRRSTHRES